MRLCEIKGIINPKELEINDSLLSLWDSYFYVRDYQLINKFEYYLAQIIQILIGTNSTEEPPEIEDILMTFDEDKILGMVKAKRTNAKDNALIGMLKGIFKK